MTCPTDRPEASAAPAGPPEVAPAGRGESARGLPRRAALGLFGASALGLQGELRPAAAAEPSRAPVLVRGVNLSHWFEYERAQCLSAEELRRLKAWGFDHVRLPLDPVVCGWQPEQPRRLPFLNDLQGAAGDIVRAGLVLVLDLHLDPDFKARVEAETGLEAAVVALWNELARAFADWPVERLVFELFNEPQYYSAPSRWAALQRRLLTAVRLQAPSHGVLLTGAQGASLEGLLALQPLADPAAAYVFHHYEPFVFTHQGVPWLDERYTLAGRRTNVRWPPAAQAGALRRVSVPSLREQQEWADYLRAGWGDDRLRAVLAVAGDWALRKGVRLVCSEFGVYRAGAEVASRYRWLSDVRTTLEAHKIGWTVWDYSHHFGITAESGQAAGCGQRTLDPQAFAALGIG